MEKSHLELDDNQGYLHFRKLSYIIISGHSRFLHRRYLQNIKAISKECPQGNMAENISHRIQSYAIFVVTFTINIPQMLAYIPYDWILRVSYHKPQVLRVLKYPEIPNEAESKRGKPRFDPDDYHRKRRWLLTKMPISRSFTIIWYITYLSEMLISTGYVTLPASNHHGRQVPKQLRFSARKPRTRRSFVNKKCGEKTQSLWIQVPSQEVLGVWFCWG